MSQHPHAELIRQWLEWWPDVRVESRYPQSVWTAEVHPQWQARLEYRVTRTRRRLGDLEYPAPETEAPAHGTLFHIPAPDQHSMYQPAFWVGDVLDLRHLERGLVHLDRDAAIQHARAMLGGRVSDE